MNFKRDFGCGFRKTYDLQELIADAHTHHVVATPNLDQTSYAWSEPQTNPKPQTPIAPSPTTTIQLMEFTYCHDRFPKQATTQKHAKYDSIFNTIQNDRWKTNPLITITARVYKRGYTRALYQETNKPQN